MRKNTDKYTHCTTCAQLVQQATLLVLSGSVSSTAMAFGDRTRARESASVRTPLESTNTEPRVWGQPLGQPSPARLALKPKSRVWVFCLYQSSCLLEAAGTFVSIFEGWLGEISTSYRQANYSNQWLLRLKYQNYDKAGARFLYTSFQCRNHKDNLFSLAAWNQFQARRLQITKYPQPTGTMGSPEPCRINQKLESTGPSTF